LNCTIDSLDKTDYPELAQFLYQFPDQNRTLDEWQQLINFRWEENPAFYEGFPRGVVLRSGNKIVGFTGNIPARMLWNGKEDVVSNGTSWFVIPQFRKYSIDLFFKRMEIIKDYVYFNSTAIDVVKRLLSTLKFQKYNCADYLYEYCGYPGKYRNYPVRKNLLYFHKLLIRILISSRTKRNSSISIERIQTSDIGDEIDLLWERTKQKYLFTNIRDSRYLLWISQRMEIFYIKKDSRLLGFFIMHKSGYSYTLVDIWGEDITKYAEYIILFLLKQNPGYNIKFPAYDENLLKAGNKLLLIRRKKECGGFYHIGNNTPLLQDRSYLTMLQGDYGL
jgi:hypothetical protein